MSRPGVLLQLALAVIAIVAALGGGRSSTSLAVLVACAAATVWIVRALVSHRISQRVDLVLLAAMLVGSAVTAVPTDAVATEPLVASIVIVVGDALRPQWVRWTWPAGAVAAACVGVLVDPSLSAAVTVAVILSIAVVASSARRAIGQASLRRLRHLEREHAAEIEQVRIAAERVITPPRLRERFPTLTAREAEVLALIAHGDSNDEIAAELFVSVPTVKSHINSLFAKTQARDRAHAIALALGTARPADRSPR